jgi:probable HAF family extracellular repeat protein
MKRVPLTLAACLALAACTDNTPAAVDPGATCQAQSYRAALAPVPPRYSRMESPRTLIPLPLDPVALTNEAVVLGTRGSETVIHSKQGGTQPVSGVESRIFWLGRYGLRVGDINSEGYVAGMSGDRAVRRDPGGNVVELGRPGVQPGTESVLAMNALGWVVGTSDDRSYFWTPCYGMQALEPVGGVAMDINRAGDITGFYNAAPPGRTASARAIVWKAWSHERVELGTLRPEHTWSWAEAINDRGWVVGWSGHPADRQAAQMWAFLWTPQDGMIDLGSLGGQGRTQAVDINTHGEVVGNTGLYAFVWRKETGMELLPVMGGGISRATAINDWGDIVGTVDGKPVVWTWPDNEHRWR